MITDHEAPEMKAAAADLSLRLGWLRAHYHNQMTERLLQDSAELIRDHRTHCRQQGIDFPVMVLLVVIRLNIMEVKRADLDLMSICQVVVNFMTEHPETTPQEMATAVLAAWPSVKPGDLVDEGTLVRYLRQQRAASNDNIEETQH